MMSHRGHIAQGRCASDRVLRLHLSVPSSSAYACFFCLSGSKGDA